MTAIPTEKDSHARPRQREGQQPFGDPDPASSLSGIWTPCGLPGRKKVAHARVTKLATLKSGRQVQRTRLVATGQGILEDNRLNGVLIIDLGTHVGR